MALLKLDKERRPRVLLVPPPDLPVPAVQGGAVETLLTHLIRENEKQGQLDLLCASVTDDAARRAAEGWQHTKMPLHPTPGRPPPLLADGLSGAVRRASPPPVMTRGTEGSSSRWHWSCRRPT